MGDESRLIPCEQVEGVVLPINPYASATWENGITAEEARRLANARRTQMGSDCSGAVKLRAAFDSTRTHKPLRTRKDR